MGLRHTPIAVAAILALLVVAPAPAATPSTTVVSKHYRYSMVVPGSPKYWTRNYAIISWTVGGVERDVPEFDTITDSRVNRFFIIGARNEPRGTTLDAWTKFFTSFNELGCKLTSSVSSSSIGGGPARAFAYSCGDGVQGRGLTMLHGERGYFMLLSSFSRPTASDQAVLNAARSSFRFT